MVSQPVQVMGRSPETLLSTMRATMRVWSTQGRASVKNCDVCTSNVLSYPVVVSGRQMARFVTSGTPEHPRAGPCRVNASTEKH